MEVRSAWSAPLLLACLAAACLATTSMASEDDAEDVTGSCSSSLSQLIKRKAALIKQLKLGHGVAPKRGELAARADALAAEYSVKLKSMRREAEGTAALLAKATHEGALVELGESAAEGETEGLKACVASLRTASAMLKKSCKLVPGCVTPPVTPPLGESDTTTPTGGTPTTTTTSTTTTGTDKTPTLIKQGDQTASKPTSYFTPRPTSASTVSAQGSPLQKANTAGAESANRRRCPDKSSDDSGKDKFDCKDCGKDQLVDKNGVDKDAFPTKPVITPKATPPPAPKAKKPTSWATRRRRGITDTPNEAELYGQTETPPTASSTVPPVKKSKETRESLGEAMAQVEQVTGQVEAEVAGQQ